MGEPQVPTTLTASRSASTLLTAHSTASSGPPHSQREVAAVPFVTMRKPRVRQGPWANWWWRQDWISGQSDSHAAGLPTKGSASEEDSGSGSRCRHQDPGGAGTPRCKRKSRVVKAPGWQAHPREGARGRGFRPESEPASLAQAKQGPRWFMNLKGQRPWLLGSCIQGFTPRHQGSLSLRPQLCFPSLSVWEEGGPQLVRTWARASTPWGRELPPELPRERPQGAWLCPACTEARG